MPPSELAWHELPIWQRDNEYIRSGYRHSSGSFTYRYKAFIYTEAQKRSTLVQLSRQANNKLIPPAHSHICPTGIIGWCLFPAGGYVPYLVLNKPK